MKYLLDTHAVWAHATDPDSLSHAARRAIDASLVDDLCFLDVTLYELSRHFAAGRITSKNPESALREISRTYRLIHTDAEIAWRSARIEWPKRLGKGEHLDPADRALVATAMIHRLVLMTADEEIHHLAKNLKFRVLW